MFKITENKTCELVEEKSRFITYLFFVNDEFEAKARLEEIKKLHFNAKHHTYGYIVGENGKTVKFSDDGEPQQTAGSVIYEQLRNKNLTFVLCIVVRYFGGIKLGASRLKRTYRKAVNNVLEITKLIKITKIYTYRITCDYKNYEIIKSRFLVKNAIHFENATFEVEIPEDEDLLFLAFINNLVIKEKERIKISLN